MSTLKKGLILTLILIFSFTRAKAVTPSEAPSANFIVLNGAIYAIAGIALYDFLNDYKPANSDGAFFALGFDPKMTFGESAFHGMSRMGYNFNKNEIFVGNEVFTAIDYYSFNAGYDRILFDSKLSFAAGAEYSMIYRPQGTFHSVGANITSRVKVTDWLYFELRSNMKTRPDISKSHIFSNSIYTYIKF